MGLTSGSALESTEVETIAAAGIENHVAGSRVDGSAIASADARSPRDRANAVALPRLRLYRPDAWLAAPAVEAD